MLYLATGVQFKNLGLSHVGILSWGNLIDPNAYIDNTININILVRSRALFHKNAKSTRDEKGFKNKPWRILIIVHNGIELLLMKLIAKIKKHRKGIDQSYKEFYSL